MIIPTVSLPHYPARPCRLQGGFGLVMVMMTMMVVMIVMVMRIMMALMMVTMTTTLTKTVMMKALDEKM